MNFGGKILSLDNCVERDAISSQEETQLDLFQTSRFLDLMHIVDAINRKKRKRALFFAAEGTSSSWKPLPSHKSPHFTTQWKELLTIRL